MNTMNSDDDYELPEEVDFTKGVRGMTYKKLLGRSNIVYIEPEILSKFPDSEAVNAGLRVLMQLETDGKISSTEWARRA